MYHNYFGIQGNGYSFRWRRIHCGHIMVTSEDITPSQTRRIMTDNGRYLTCDEYKVLQVQDA
jgi:hypothetical protein